MANRRRKSKRFYRLRKAWDRIVSLASYVDISIPVSYLFVHHSVTYVGGTVASHKAYLKLVEREHNLKLSKKMRKNARQQAKKAEKSHNRYLEQVALNRGFSGISYTDIIYPSGRVYVGRSFRKVGAHTMGYNEKGFGFVVVGNYENDNPTKWAVTAIVQTAAKAVKWKKAVPGSFLLGHRDVKATACPGKKLYARVPEIRARFRELVK